MKAKRSLPHGWRPARPPYPKMIRLRYPVVHGTRSPMTDILVFVENDGVRFDNAGPIPPKQVRRLMVWCEKYLAAWV
jgi:hypothetical protein